MKILNVIIAYNAITTLPYVVAHYKDIPIYVIDNYSTDGTWEYLQENKIQSERIDTNGAFDLTALQQARIRVYKRFNPEWVIYGDADEFITGNIKELLDDNYNQIAFQNIDFYYTGEKRKLIDPRKQFSYCILKENDLVRIHKLDGFEGYDGDNIKMEEDKIKYTNNCILDFGMTETKQKREDTFNRRKIAWERGLPRVQGIHYKPASEQNWIWDKKDLTNFKITKWNE